MARKEFTYRGRTTEDLMRMSIKEFAALVPSTERRALLRGMTDVEKSLLRKLVKRNNVKTQAREMVIVPQMVGKTILLHNGKEYSPIAINEEMLGFRLGEFLMTRKPIKHSAPGIGSTASTKSVSVK
jgi:small subunit ribosomal protein S19